MGRRAGRRVSEGGTSLLPGNGQMGFDREVGAWVAAMRGGAAPAVTGAEARLRRRDGRRRRGIAAQWRGRSSRRMPTDDGRLGVLLVSFASVGGQAHQKTMYLPRAARRIPRALVRGSGRGRGSS